MTADQSPSTPKGIPLPTSGVADGEARDSSPRMPNLINNGRN